MASTTIQWFKYEHLPEGNVRATSASCSYLAHLMENGLPDGPEKSAGMRKLLEAKDCFVRSALANMNDYTTYKEPNSGLASR